jgi:hypothetical protein
MPNEIVDFPFAGAPNKFCGKLLRELILRRTPQLVA